MTTTVTLPYPPVLNNLYANVPGRGRVKSKRYHEWANAAGWELQSQRPTPVPGKVSVSILLGKPDNRRRDLDGTSKAPLDLLVRHGVIEDDSLVQSLTLSWAKVSGCVVTVEPA